ncbi:phage tailspike protein [Serratia marcescens]|uniref:phage head-binding domain-containing protein n=1 Tax=Serratia TaxID=613 RepID=UPI003BA2EBDB
MADNIVPNVVVSMPSQQFTMARSFKAASNGKIYIGKIDTDPTIPENQIPVYLENEDGSHVQIAQPIIVNAGGYPVYNGQIAKFVTVQGHSMAIYDAFNVQQFYFPNVLKYDPDQYRQQLEGPGGAVFEVNVRQFGAKTVEEDPNFDSQPAFQAAIDYVNANGGGVVNFKGTYRISNAPFTYVLPYDDGSYSPLFTSGERTLPPETPSTMKAHLELPSGVRLHGEAAKTSVLNFGWDHDNGPISLNGTIGIVARVQGYPQNTRMTTYIRQIELDKLTIRNVFIGFVADGIMFDQSRMGDVTYAWCGIPLIAQGVDSSIWGYQELIGNYAGLVIGGMWLHRNNTQSGGKWVPPYVDGTDIYSLGWCDYLTMSNITASGKQWSTRHSLVDNFFDREFYKSRHDVTEANGGRLTNQHAGDLRPSDYSKDPYRGIAGRAFCLFARYKRGNSIGMLTSRAKIFYSPRTPFLTPSPNSGYSGIDWYGYIEYGFAERVGLRDMNGPNNASNWFYESGSDPINRDQTTLPASIVEGSIQCKTHALAATPSAPVSTSALRKNYRSTNVYYTRNSDTFRNAPKTADNMMRYGFVYSPEANTGTIYERLWIGRYEIQPLCFKFDDKNELHHWRTRTSSNETGLFRLRSGYNGAVVFPDAVTRNLVYRGGIVECYFSFQVTAEMVAMGQTELWISGFPNNSAGTHDFGSDMPYINIINARIKKRPIPVNGGGGGTVDVAIPIGSCRTELGQLCMYLDQGRDNPLRYGDLVAGYIFSAVVVYNTPWGLYNTDEGLNGKQE